MANIRDEKNANADRLAEEFLRESEPVRLDEILPDVMADIEKRMDRPCGGGVLVIDLDVH